MKKTSLAALALWIIACLWGCGASNAPSKQEGFAFTYHTVQITPGAEAESILEALGEPKSYTEEPSCAFDGMDKTYYYGSFYLSTYPLEGKDYVQRIWLADDSVATAEGIRIGSGQAEVEKAYGANFFNGSNAFISTKGNTRLTVIIEDGIVSSIQYEVIID